MVKKIKVIMIFLLLGGYLCACGKEKETMEPSAEDSQQEQPGDEKLDWYIDPEKNIQHYGIDVFDPDSSEEVPENVIIVGARAGDYINISEQISAFNWAQDDYKVEVQRYETMDAMILDLVRGKGCDLLVLSSNYLTILSDKGELEDLAPYLEKSEKVNREDLFDVVLEVGTADGKLAGILPGFAVQAILVEKGYTEEGGWTIEEYLALMDKYPDIPLKKCTDTESALSWIALELSGMLESYVDWEERSCNFESEEFIRNIEMVKNYFVQLTNTGSELFKSDAKMLYDGQVLTATVEVGYGKYFSGYQDIRDAFLDNYELAGIPCSEGEAKYPMEGMQNVLYCMNAASAKKDAVWTFLEYILSEYQETMVEGHEQLFPARRDIVERVLQEEVEAELTDKDYRANFYTKEMVPQRGNFTEEDKERILYILDHTSPPTVLQSGGVFWVIMTEELGAFLSGDKTAEETARIIQSRVSLYLSE